VNRFQVNVLYLLEGTFVMDAILNLARFFF